MQPNQMQLYCCVLMLHFTTHMAILPTNMPILGTCKSEIFIRIESRIKSAATIRIRNQSAVVYVFNANYHRSSVKTEVIIIITDEQRCADSPGSTNKPQTILHDHSYSANECVCTEKIIKIK